MFAVFVVLVGGIVVGRQLSGRRLAFVQPLTTGIIRLLLFLLGAEAGGNPELVAGFGRLGLTAFVVFACSTAGSIAAAWLLWLAVRRRIGAEAEIAADERVPLWQAMRGSGVIVAFFAAGVLTGLCGVLPAGGAVSRLSVGVLYALMCCVGLSLGSDRTLATRIRQLDPRLALLPVATAVGTLGGAVVAAWALASRATDMLAVGAGFGYYSLSSIFIADLRGAELATVALLCNLMRELFTLLFAPLAARAAGPLAAVSAGGATSFDTTLPVITCAAGRPYALVAIFHGCVLDFSVPFLVTLFCSF